MILVSRLLIKAIDSLDQISRLNELLYLADEEINDFPDLRKLVERVDMLLGFYLDSARPMLDQAIATIELLQKLLSYNSTQNSLFLPPSWPYPKFWFGDCVSWNRGRVELQGAVHGLEFYLGKWHYLFFAQNVFDFNGNPLNLHHLDKSVQVVPEDKLVCLKKTFVAEPVNLSSEDNLMFELSQTDAELVARVSQEHPDAAIWIVSMVTQKPFYMNAVAREQTRRTASQLMDGDVLSFWDYPKLERLMERLPREREVKNYEGEGWIFGQENGFLWQRVKCQYLTDYYVLGDCLGEPARLSVVKQATAVS